MAQASRERAYEQSDLASSVGAALDKRQVHSSTHPAYLNFSRAVMDELAQVVDRENVRRTSALPLVCCMALDAQEQSDLAVLYPEFSVTTVPVSKPVHAFWRASVLAANQWLAWMTQKYATTYVHVGASLVGAMVMGYAGCHAEYDFSDPVVLHGAHTETVNLHRLYQDYESFRDGYGIDLNRAEYEKYLRREAYTQCSELGSCTHDVEAMCVDLTAVEMTPAQVALGMIQHGAEVAHGFFIYHPDMLVKREGELEGTGVHFRRQDDSIMFDYPEGRSGVRSYKRSTWATWLSSHCFRVGYLQDWFHLELLKVRGCFMFFRLVKVPPPSKEMEIHHALELAGADDYMLVKSWRVKDGFGSDFSDPDAWEPHHFLARERIVHRVEEFAMQLAPAQFTRYAVKKQIRAIHSRWVVTGTTVVTAPVLTSAEIEDLTTAIFSHCFVKRYESSRLTSEMMARLKNLVLFSSANTANKWRMVAAVVYEQTVTGVVKGIVDALDSLTAPIIRRFGRKLTLPVETRRAPRYLRLSTVAGSWLTAWRKSGEGGLRLLGEAGVADIGETALGGQLAKGLLVLGRHGTTKAGNATSDLANVARDMTELRDTRVSGEGDEDVDPLVDHVAVLNEMDEATSLRHNMEYTTVVRQEVEVCNSFRRADDPDPVYSLNQMYLQLFPGIAKTRLEYDTFSLSLDPQDRTLAAAYLRMPAYFGLPPAPREYYVSNLRALSVPKRQNTAHELLTAVSARNLAAPVISLPQEDDVLVRDIWDVFLEQACVPDAREKLMAYQADPVGMDKEAYSDWISKAKPGVLDSIRKDLQDNSRSLGQMPVSEYLAMLKSDVKPTLSNKPLAEVTAPQVIVYHEKPVSSFYSSLFRVLVRRFLSLLKPNYHVNLLKDSRDITEFITANHPWDKAGLQYLENDFSKYDKSQAAFVFLLEQFVFEQLGMNSEMLAMWVDGHVECTMRSLAVGLTLHVMYQRKSGDATTAFGNVILNILSVTYCYKGTKVAWAAFMGDDSLVCATALGKTDDSVRMLAELFNLTAKLYVTGAPYYASNFLILDEARQRAVLVPDVVKRIERLSMHISADEPSWGERFQSYCDSMSMFTDPELVAALAVVVPQRYEVGENYVRSAAGALGTLSSSFARFRSVWEDKPQLLAA